jgi:two-component system response regulator HydG
MRRPSDARRRAGPAAKARLRAELQTVERALAESRLAREARYHRWASNLFPGSPDLIGGSAAFKTAMELARVVGGSDATVPSEGESGTGKERIGRGIHAWSSRQERPFIAVNVGAIPESLMEAELFGAKRGSYTGAHADRRGHFASAEGGTLFLDEIGETSPDIQVRLLRAIQEREITPLGESKPRKIDVRIVAATNRGLKAEVDNNQFRRDLYYRLAVVKITLPPLRERIADIEPIALHFLEKQRHSLGKPIRGFAPEAVEKLQRHLWPGNVRELSNVIERAVIYSVGEWITPDLLLLEVPGKGVSGLETLLDRKFREAETDFERLYFRRLLETHGGNRSKAAIAAGLERSVLHAHLRKTGLDSGSR